MHFQWFLSYWLMTVSFFVALCGCSTMTQIRIQNVSPYDYTDVKISDRNYGNIESGETSGYRDVTLYFRYAAMKMNVDGKYVTGQALHFGADRFTYKIDVIDLNKGHLAIDMIREKSIRGDQ